MAPGKSKSNEEYLLDDVGFAFARKCIEVMEVRGLEEEGLYRIGGVNTKITKLLILGMDRNKTEKERLQFFYDEQHSDLLETKTIASALKHYLRNLNEPLMTYRYHNGFIAAASEFCSFISFLSFVDDVFFGRRIKCAIFFIFRARNTDPENKRCTYVSLSTAQSQFRDARNYNSPFESVSCHDFENNIRLFPIVILSNQKMFIHFLQSVNEMP